MTTWRGEQITLQDTVESYRKHVPYELQKAKIWMPSIGRRPMFKFKGQHAQNLRTFDKALEEIGNEEWIKKQRDYMAKNFNEEKFRNDPVHLTAVLTNTDMCFADPDKRWLFDEHGNVIKDDNGKNKHVDEFGDDQINVIDNLRDDCPGWASWGGCGIHSIMIRKKDTCQITAHHVNRQINGEYLSPCEVKFHSCYLPPILQPLNKRRHVSHTPDYINEHCRRVEKFRKQSNSKPEIQDTQDTTPPAEKKPDFSSDKSSDRLKNQHPGLERLLEQYRELAKHKIRFLPDGYAQWGAWHRRLTTMGCPTETIKKIADSQPGYNRDKDPYEIDKSKPFPGDPNDQAKIEFSRIKKIFDKHRIPLLIKSSIPKNNNKGLVDWENLTRPEPIGKFAPRGEIALLAAKAGTGKSCLTLARIAEITNLGFKVLYLSGDMNLVDMRPHLAANGTNLNNFRAIDDLTLLNDKWLLEVMREWKPDLIVMDSFIDCLACLASEFMWDSQTQKMGKFDPNCDPMTWVKVFGWLKPWARKWNVSVYGLVHPAKDRFGHDLPHSSKLQGYLHRWDMLYRKGSNMKGFPYSAVARILDDSPDGTRIEWNGKRRRNTERMHTMYNLVEADLDLLHEEDQDEKIMTMINVKEFSDTDEFLRVAGGEEMTDSHGGVHSDGRVKSDRIEEADVMRSICDLIERSSDEWTTVASVINSLARRDEMKKQQVETHFETLGNRKIIQRQSSGRGFKVRLYPDQEYDFGSGPIAIS